MFGMDWGQRRGYAVVAATAQVWFGKVRFSLVWFGMDWGQRRGYMNM